MALYNSVKKISAVAGADLTGKVGYFVAFNASAQLVVATTAQGPVDGVLTQDGTSGQAVSYAVPDGGRVPVVAGAALAAGAAIACGADGRAVAFTATLNGNQCWGVLMEAAAAADDFVQCAFFPKDVGVTP
jgi:hypothetical protein